MSVDKDDTLHSTAEDAEFAALMAASSLGAPHVQTCATGIDEGTRGQLRAAVAATGDATLPHPRNEELDVAAAAAPQFGVGADAAAADDRQAGTGASTLGKALPMRPMLILINFRLDDSIVARRRVLALLTDQAVQDWGGTSWRRADRGDGILLVGPSGRGRAETATCLLREALRGAARNERLHERRMLHPAGEAAWWLRADWEKESRPRPDYLLEHDRRPWIVEAKHLPNACLQRLMREVCEWSQVPGRLPELQPALRPAPLPSDGLALNVDEPIWRTVYEAGGIPRACLTDLLHAPPPSPWALLTLHCAQLSEWREAFVWKPCRPGGTRRTLLGRNALAACEGRNAAGLFDVRPESLPDLTLAADSLLVASELAMDLDTARRHPIPAQAATLPNMDECTVLPGSTLFVPRGDQGTLELAPSPAGPDLREGEERMEGTGQLLWSKKDKEGGERQARLWMRVHLHEGDTGERLPVTLIYSQADRHAIAAVFYASTDSEVRWTFARELLVDGLHRSVGIGDVIVWPTEPAQPAETSNVQRVHIRLRSPEGTALLSVARPDIAAFLDVSEPLASSAVTETDNGGGGGAVVGRRRTAGRHTGLGIRSEGDGGDQRAVCVHRSLRDGGGGEGFGHGGADSASAVTDEQGQEFDRGRPPVMTGLPGQVGADVPGGGIGKEPRHQGVDVRLASQFVQDPTPAPPDALQVARGLPGIGEQRRVEREPLLGRGDAQGLQSGKEADGGQGIVLQVRDGAPEPLGEGRTRHGLGEFTESPERDIAASGVHDEIRGPAPYLFIRVGESSERGLGGIRPSTPGPSGQEVHDLTTYERVVGPGELKQPDGRGAGAVGAYRVEDRDAGRVGGSRGVSRGHGFVQPLHRTGRWPPFRAENSGMRLIMSCAATPGPRLLSSERQGYSLAVRG
ncbi:SsgA family sporulation/cell division regulator [Streptomyces virginiae]|uniref:SsgA family sporulation/cell division regulator n=1 Tax=Streptomyces virginiae TaxID=1961 RepID=A0ABZ1TNW3_STRVG|nr:SsgA family sporulation/cell division regulator [Streptomyces virginiae]